jgi:thiol:disulfide interchange protein
VPGGGRRRQTSAPLRAKIRWDLLAWGALAGVAAGVVLGLTGGGWLRALVLAVLVVGASAVLTLLAATSARKSARRPTGGRRDGSGP